jgi:hypothetical protein
MDMETCRDMVYYSVTVPLLPLLFNSALEYVISEVKDGRAIGIKWDTSTSVPC